MSSAASVRTSAASSATQTWTNGGCLPPIELMRRSGGGLTRALSFLGSDSKTASTVTHELGDPAPRLAEYEGWKAVIEADLSRPMSVSRPGAAPEACCARADAAHSQEASCEDTRRDGGHSWILVPNP